MPEACLNVINCDKFAKVFHKAGPYLKIPISLATFIVKNIHFDAIDSVLDCKPNA